MLTSAEAVALIARLGHALNVPAMDESDIRKIVEVELRSGGRHVEVYIPLEWSAFPDDDDPPPGPGVSCVTLFKGRDAWQLVSVASRGASTNSAAALEAALDALERFKAESRPKPARHAAPARRRKALKPLSEAEGAGALGDVLVTTEARAHRATRADVEAAERTLGTRLPAGYRTYAERLGEGVYGNRLRVYLPAQIVETLSSWRERIECYWFWGDAPLAQESALECVRIADTIDGDELVFHPSDPDALYLLPRGGEHARSMGRGLARAVAKLVRAKQPVLEPFTPHSE